MPTYQQRGKRWRVEVMRDGVRHSATRRTRAEAVAWAEGQRRGIKGAPTLRDALTRYSDEVSPTKRGVRWEQIRITAFIRLIPFVDKPLDRIGPDDISDWRDLRLKDVSAGSVVRDLTVLSAVFQWALIERRWVHANPCHSIRWPAKPPPRKRRVHQSDIDGILKACGWQDQPPKNKMQEVALAFLLAIETAMRAGELLSLAPEQVFLEQRYAHLDRTKNGDSRDVPLSTEAVRLLGMIPGGFTLRPASLDVLFRKARDRAGLADLHFHDTRREAATRLSKKLQPMELAAMTGHRDLKTLLSTYYAPSPSEAARKLD